MRLINVYSLELKEFITDIPRYAILSHRWSDDEISSKEYRKEPRVESIGYKKDLLETTEARPPRPVEWVWIDTVTIDKKSSAELSEAINSMYDWYYNATLCVAYFADVPKRDPHLQPTAKLTWMYDYLAQSRWFHRGWTLQELLAPQIVIFANSAWEEFGRKDETLALRSSNVLHQDFLDVISQITYIPRVYIGLRDAIDRACFAEKMSWASRRQTSRPEDRAYCLLGLLNVNMPLLYGEGPQRAFLRLQQQFIQQSDDESIFAWNNSLDYLGSPCGILASSPSDFLDSGQIGVIPATDTLYTSRPPYAITNKGLSFETVAYSLRRDDSTNAHEPRKHGVPRIIIDRELPQGPVYAVPLNCRTTVNSMQHYGRVLCILEGQGRVVAPPKKSSRVGYAGDKCFIFLREHETGMAVGETSDYFDDPDSSLVLGFAGEKDRTPKRLFVKLQIAAPRIATPKPPEQRPSTQDIKTAFEIVHEKVGEAETHGIYFQVTPAEDQNTGQAKSRDSDRLALGSVKHGITVSLEEKPDKGEGKRQKTRSYWSSGESI